VHQVRCADSVRDDVEISDADADEDTGSISTQIFDGSEVYILRDSYFAMSRTDFFSSVLCDKPATSFSFINFLALYVNERSILDKK